MWKLEPLCTVGCEMGQLLWQIVLVYLKKLKIEPPQDPIISLLASQSRRIEIRTSKSYLHSLHSQAHCSTIHNSQDIENNLSVL